MLVFFDSHDATLQIRTKRANCAACGSDKENSKITEETGYVAFCGGSQPDWETVGLVPAKADERMSTQVWLVSLKTLAILLVMLRPEPA